MKLQSDNFHELIILVLLIIIMVLVGFVMAQTVMSWMGY